MTELARTEQLDVMTLGKVLQQSGYFTDVKDAAQAVVKIIAGQEMGIGAVAAMTGIYIVKGRVTLSANLMAAQIKRSGRYNYIIREMTDTGCSIEYFEGGQSIGVSSFTADDAKAAQLLGGDNWKKFPRNMYFARAMSNGAKWYCPDVFSGPVYTPDELGSMPPIDQTTGEIIDHVEASYGSAASGGSGDPRTVKPQAVKPERTPAELIDAIRELWSREKALDAHSTPPDELATDLETAPVARLKELGRNAQSRLAALRKAEGRPA